MKAKNSGWVSKKLGQIVEMTSGGTPDKKFKEYYDGGTILFGVDDDGNVIGLPDVKQACLDVENKIKGISPMPQ